MLSYTGTRAWGVLLLAGCLFSLSAGCGGPNYKARATVKGKVTFGGKNLTIGSVTFINKDKIQGTGRIDKDGTYVCNDAPVGECVVTVTVPAPPQGPPGVGTNPFAGAGEGAKGTKSVDPNNPNRSISIMGEIPPTVVRIPEKYSKPETSGLTHKVEKGETTHNIDLKP